MEVAHIYVSGTQAHPGRVQPITAGIVGAVVRMSYTDDLWDGLIRNVVFRHEGKSVVILNAGKTVQLPAELVAEPSREPVFVGVCGVDANDTVLIPTLWAKIGPVNSSPSLSGEPAADPSLPIWAQLQQTADGAIQAPAVAEVGQTIAVTAVDDNGKPIEWKAVDFPSGGSGGSNGSANCLLTVETITIGEPGEPGNIPVAGITLDYSSISLKAGEFMMLAASVTPSNATNTAIIWETSDDSIAKVENGLVTALASGNCTITAKSAENYSIKATCAVAVVAESDGTVTVLYRNLDIVQGSLAKVDGTIAAISNGMYVEFPYYEGMMVSTLSNSNWYISYPPIAVYTNGVYNSVDYTEGDLVGGTKHYTATLAGYPAGSVVRVNIFTGTLAIEDADEYLYYSYES